MKLEDIVTYAYTNVPFYMNLLEQCHREGRLITDKMQEFPVFDKSMITDWRDLQAMQYVFGQQKDLFSAFTSGSTGECLEIKWDQCDYIASMLPLWIKAFMRKKAIL